MKRAALACFFLALTDSAFAQSEHVPPDPPQTHVHAMPYGEMAQMMGMDDRRRFRKVMFDHLEWHDAEESTFEWDAAAWYGGDFNKLWVESEGERVAGSTADARVEVLWDRIATAWWSTRLGVRQDFGEGPDRSWIAAGVAGLAPGFIELEAMAYVGDGSRTALRFAADYDMLITQRLVLNPEVEVNLYGDDDPARLIGAGLSDLEMGLRLRYEFRREIAPYFGVSWTRRFGDSADFAEAAGEDPNEVEFVAGIRLWF
jgi:copper resistance protein B